jgi:hypothetical protein
VPIGHRRLGDRAKCGASDGPDALQQRQEDGATRSAIWRATSVREVIATNARSVVATSVRAKAMRSSS